VWRNLEVLRRRNGGMDSGRQHTNRVADRRGCVVSRAGTYGRSSQSESTHSANALSFSTTALASANV
jgi:hypothetical protein